MAPEKEWQTEEPVTITLTLEQWEIMRHWLDYGACYHHAKMTECLGGVIEDKRMAMEMAVGHERSMRQAECLLQIIEEAIHGE